MRIKFHTRFLNIALVACLLSLSACSGTLLNVGARSGAPESAQTELVEIPHDSASPTYAVVVEPFEFNEGIDEEFDFSLLDQSEVARQMAAQLTSALANAGNLSVIDSQFEKHSVSFYKKRMAKDHVGPFVVKALVTELNESAELEKSVFDVALGWIGTALVFAGEITDKPALSWAGVGLAVTNPTIKHKKEIKKGVVAIDFQVHDASTSRLLTSFRTVGTFASASAEAKFGLLGMETGEKKEVKSILAQAIRVAINDAVLRLDDTLKSKFVRSELASL